MHLMRVINGKMLQVHLCATCAAEFGLQPPDEAGVDPGDLMDTLKKLEELGKELTQGPDLGELPDVAAENGELGPAEVLDALRKGLEKAARDGDDGEESRADGKRDEGPNGRCPACGLTVRRMIRTRSCRCPACYEALVAHLDWGSGSPLRPYEGKVPDAADAEVRLGVALSRLKGRMRAASCAERYEEAEALNAEARALQADASSCAGRFKNEYAPAEQLVSRAGSAAVFVPHEAGVLRVGVALVRNLEDEPFFEKSRKKGGDGVMKRVESAVDALDIAPPMGVRVRMGKKSHVLISVEGAVADADVLLEAVLSTDAQLEAAGLRWAFDPQLGYLAPSLARCGTGLDVRALLHLPALHALGRIAPANRLLEELGLELEPLVPRPALPYYWLRMHRRLALERPFPMDTARDEKTVLADTLAVARALARQDYEAMQRLDACWVEDRFLRAASTLALARRLGRDEAMALLSDVRMGAALGLDPAPVPLDAKAFLPPARFYGELFAMESERIQETLVEPLPSNAAAAEEVCQRARAAYFSRFFPDGRRPAAGCNAGGAADDSLSDGAEPPPSPTKTPRRGRPPRRKPKGPAE